MPPTTYAQRLAEALGVSPSMAGWDGSDREKVKRLAAALGISRQAVEKYFRDSSNAMSAPNNSKAARYLRVDPDWLATGDGKKHARAWVFGNDLSPEDFFGLTAEEIRPALDVLQAAILRRKAAPRKLNGTNGH